MIYKVKRGQTENDRMRIKVFLDTNVIIDFYARREEFFKPAAVIIDLAVEGYVDIYVSSLTFVNAFYVLRKTYNVDDLYQKLQSLSELCRITGLDEDNIKYCLENRSLDFEDTVQYMSAMSIKPDVIVTRNIKHFKNVDVEVNTPTSFLDCFFGNKDA